MAACMADGKFSSRRLRWIWMDCKRTLRPTHPLEKRVRGAALVVRGFKEQDADHGKVADGRVMAGTQHPGLFLPSWKARS
jgi:hypothetical protein